MKFEILNRFTKTVIFSLECDSLKFCVETAYKSESSLRDADLRGAAEVASLGQPNGWNAFAWHKDKTVMVQVGCNSFTLADGREYWNGKEDREEVMAALDYAEAIANLRGWTK